MTFFFNSSDYLSTFTTESTEKPFFGIHAGLIFFQIAAKIQREENDILWIRIEVSIVQQCDRRWILSQRNHGWRLINASSRITREYCNTRRSRVRNHCRMRSRIGMTAVNALSFRQADFWIFNRF